MHKYSKRGTYFIDIYLTYNYISIYISLYRDLIIYLAVLCFEILKRKPQKMVQKGSWFVSHMQGLN